jgi:hypothetical protein
MGLNVIKVRFRTQVDDVPKGLEIQVPTQCRIMPDGLDIKKVLQAMGYRAAVSNLNHYCERVD